MRSPMALRRSNASPKKVDNTRAYARSYEEKYHPSPNKGPQVKYKGPSATELTLAANSENDLLPLNKSKRPISVKLSDVNRPPHTIEMAIRGTYGLLLAKPKQDLRGQIVNADKVINQPEDDNEETQRVEGEKEMKRLEKEKKKSGFAMKFRKKTLNKAKEAKHKLQKERRYATLDWSTSEEEEEEDDESVRYEEREEEEAVAVDPLTNLLQLHLPKNTSLDGVMGMRTTQFKEKGDTAGRKGSLREEGSGYSVTPADDIVRASAMRKLTEFHRNASGLVIQTAYRKWTSKQMVVGWVTFSQMKIAGVDEDTKDAKYVPPPNAFQERLSGRAYKRLQMRQVRLMFRSWAGMVKAFVRCRERILDCYAAKKLSNKMVGWLRVVKRQMALKKVVYIQERLVRFRHFRLWRGLTIIKRNMFWCQRRALHAWLHYIRGTATLNRDRWEHICDGMKRLWASNYIKWWYKGTSTRNWYKRYLEAAYRVKDEIMRRLGKEVLESRNAAEIERLSRERATMKKISRRAVAALREYIATEEGSDDFNVYWRIVRKHRRTVKKVEMRKLRLLKKRARTVAGELGQVIKIQTDEAKEIYKDYFKTDWKVPAYQCCEERINYESRKVSRENFRREQSPLYDCEHCKKPFVFDYLKRRHKLIYQESCKPKVPDHLEWVKADKFSKAAMQRIVDIFYSHLVSDRLKGKRGAGVAMMAASGGAGAAGSVLEGIDAGERKAATTGWGKIKMAVGDENREGKQGEAASLFGGAVSGLRGKLMMAKQKAEELVEEGVEEEEEKEEEIPPQWCEAKEHPLYSKFFSLVPVVGELSVKKRMDGMGFDPTVLDEPECMIGLDTCAYKDRRVPLNIIEEGVDNYDNEEHDVQDFKEMVDRAIERRESESEEENWEKDAREKEELQRKLERFGDVNDGL